MLLPIFATTFFTDAWFIILVTVAVFALLAIATWLIYRTLNREAIKKGNPQSPEEIAKEEEARILRPYIPEEEAEENPTEEPTE